VILRRANRAGAALRRLSAGDGAVELDRLIASLDPGKPVVPIVFIAPCCSRPIRRRWNALCAALTARGLAPAALVVPSLKDRAAAAFLQHAFAKLGPAQIVTMTAFAAGGQADEPSPLGRADVPVLQVIQRHHQAGGVAR